MEYTKWHLGDVRAFGGYYIYDEQGRLVAECPTVQGVDKLANARLISLAPDLYEALKQARKWLDDFANDAPITFGGEAELDEVLRQALAKVKGGNDGNTSYQDNQEWVYC